MVICTRRGSSCFGLLWLSINSLTAASPSAGLSRYSDYCGLAPAHSSFLRRETWAGEILGSITPLTKTKDQGIIDEDSTSAAKCE